MLCSSKSDGTKDAGSDGEPRIPLSFIFFSRHSLLRSHSTKDIHTHTSTTIKECAAPAETTVDSQKKKDAYYSGVKAGFDAMAAVPAECFAGKVISAEPLLERVGTDRTGE